MFALINCIDDPPVFHFTYTTLGLDDNEWHHTTPALPLVEWVDNILIPLARQRGDSLTLEETVQTLYKQTQKARISFEDFDWLGLALFVSHRCRETLGKIAGQTSGPISEEGTAWYHLANVWSQIYQRVSVTRQDSFRQWLTGAA